MENISTHIADLLYHHDCVVVPGLGGFVANSVSAIFDEEKNIFFPPSKEIVFNSNLKHNDGLLISHIANMSDVSFEAAGDMVNEFVNSVKLKLKSGEKISFGKVGELSGGNNGAIVFTSNKNENFNTDSFGLSSFHFTPVVPYQRRTYRIHPAVKRSIPFRTRHIAAGIAVLAGLFIFSPDIKSPSINQAGGIEFMMPGNDFAPPKTAEEPMVSDRPVSTPASVSTHKEETDNFNYFIIAGSFRKKEQADRFCKHIKAKENVNPLIIKSSNGRFRVAVNGFDTKDKALTALKSIRTHKEFKQAWILSQK